MIEVKSIGKAFGGIQAVDVVHFAVSGGEVFGLLGENGAGKTTTLRMLATMLKPTSGTAVVEGYDIVRESERVRAHIGILFGGEAGLYDRLSARENIAYFAELNDMDREETRARIASLARAFDMEEYLDRPCGTFSKGMKQKVAFARAIVHNPPVMLFDEPTSGLDPTAQNEVHAFILRCQQEGKTIVLSSHSMDEVNKLCDRVGIIHKGRLMENETIDALLQKYKKATLGEVFSEVIAS